MTPKTNIDADACRVCLKEDKRCQSLFGKNSSNESFALMLCSIAELKVIKGDGYPQNICTACSEVLVKAYKLKVLALRNNLLLKGIIKQATSSEFDHKLKLEIKIENQDESPNQDETFKRDKKAAELSYTRKRKKKKRVETNDFFAEPNLSYVKKKTQGDTFFDGVKPNHDDSLFEDNNDTLCNDNFGDDYFEDDDPADPDFIPDPNMTMQPQTLSSTKMAISKTIDVKNTIKKAEPKKKILNKNPMSMGVSKLFKSKMTKVKLKPKNVPNHMPYVPRAREVNVKSVCEICGLMFLNMKQHMNSHNDKKYKCQVCNERFEKKSELLEHQLTHSDVPRDHVCDVCAMRFFTLRHLKRHKEIHKERKFKCEYCDKKFPCPSSVARHTPLHLGTKDFACACGVAFSSKHLLDQHQRTHTGERPYSCDICNVNFAYKANLNSHVLKTHGINMRFQTIKNVTQEKLQMLIDRAALENMQCQ